MNVIERNPPFYSRTVAAARGTDWLMEGFALYRKSLLTWIVLTIIMIAICLAALTLPIIGLPLFNVLLPFFYAGSMIGCRTLESGGKLELAHLFSGFHEHEPALFAIGGANFASNVVIAIIAHLFGLDTMIERFLTATPDATQTVFGTVGSAVVALLIGFAIYLPLLMLLYFSPLLVVFRGVPALSAMTSSFIACCRNWRPFLLYAAAVTVSWYLALLPLLLGLLVLLPTLLCAVYVSYKDIYGVASIITVRGVKKDTDAG